MKRQTKERRIVNEAAVKRAATSEQVKEIEKEMVKDECEVCLQPMVEGGGYMKIPLEEVESFYRFTVSCDWLLCESSVNVLVLFIFSLEKYPGVLCTVGFISC